MHHLPPQLPRIISLGPHALRSAVNPIPSRSSVKTWSVLCLFPRRRHHHGKRYLRGSRPVSQPSVQSKPASSVFNLADLPQLPADCAPASAQEGNPRRQVRSWSPVFAPRPLSHSIRYKLRSLGLDFDKTMGYPGEGPSTTSSSDSELEHFIGFPSREGPYRRVIVAQALRSSSVSEPARAHVEEASGICRSSQAIESTALHRARVEATLRASLAGSVGTFVLQT